MPFTERKVSPGQSISAKGYTELLTELDRVGKFMVHPPLTMITGPNGIQLAFDGIASSSAAYIKFEAHEGETYPASSSGCKIFMGVKYAASIEDHVACTDSINEGEAGDEIDVYSLTEQYIPVNTVALCHRIGGSWITEWVRETIKGKLVGEMAGGGTATLTVWKDGAATSETVTVHDWLLGSASNTIAAGSRVVASFDRQEKKYYVGGANCGSG